ncbi:MAG: putative metal-dependent rane protease [Edaphobacter sp.]|nr:putative metal-dependent rane protease [Edaphobacter sp.]
MNTEAAGVQNEATPPETSVVAAPSEVKLWQRVFYGRNGIRSGWRVIVYVAIFAAALYLLQNALLKIPSIARIIRSARQGTLNPAAQLLTESTTIASAFGAAWIMSKIEKRKFGAYGIPLRGALGKTFWLGIVFGLLFETVEMLLISAMGGFSFGTLALAGTELAKFAGLWAVGFFMVGVFEEFLFRGYAQFTLAEGIGFWPSALLLSTMFGAVHLGNPGEGWVGALSVAMFGIFACFTLYRTGNLWFAIGFHAATDYAETFIYSVPDSGLLATGHLLNSTLHGPRWLSGGTIGPEGSVVDFALTLAGFFVVALLFPKEQRLMARKIA